MAVVTVTAKIEAVEIPIEAWGSVNGIVTDFQQMAVTTVEVFWCGVNGAIPPCLAEAIEAVRPYC